jgi:hypothetical protein
MTIHQYLIKARQDDARRAGERDRLLLEARRARRAHRQRPDPAAPARWLARLLFRRVPAAPRSFPAASEQTGKSHVQVPLSGR